VRDALGRASHRPSFQQCPSQRPPAFTPGIARAQPTTHHPTHHHSHQASPHDPTTHRTRTATHASPSALPPTAYRHAHRTHTRCDPRTADCLSRRAPRARQALPRRTNKAIERAPAGDGRRHLSHCQVPIIDRTPGKPSGLVRRTLAARLVPYACDPLHTACVPARHRGATLPHHGRRRAGGAEAVGAFRTARAALMYGGGRFWR